MCWQEKATEKGIQQRYRLIIFFLLQHHLETILNHVLADSVFIIIIVILCFDFSAVVVHGFMDGTGTRLFHYIRLYEFPVSFASGRAFAMIHIICAHDGKSPSFKF